MSEIPPIVGRRSNNHPCAATGESPDVVLTSKTSQWMIMDLSLISLDGTTCNKVGTNYEAFQFQSVRSPYGNMKA